MSMYQMTLTERDSALGAGFYSSQTYDLGETWSRFPEVVLFADRNRVSIESAIRTLVEAGLSYLDYPFTGEEIKGMAQRVNSGTV